jgi:tRNA (guanine-N(7)-)-methyltransferase subunit TRM82
MREAKRRRIVASNDENDEEVDEDAIDISNPPLLGHVSMLTDLVLTSFTSTSPQSPENYIITCDRDEHIRISRWGKRRAGHLALRYLLGSSDAIGGLCVIEHELLDVLQKSVTTESARKVCESPVLLSTDSTFLRFWSLHKDTKTSSRKDLVHVLDLKAFIAPYLMVDPKREKDRERLFGKGKVDSKNLQKKLEGTVWANAEDVGGKNIGALKANVESDAVVMTHLSAMHVAEEVYVCFVVEGASALFTIALSRLLSSPTEEAGNHIHALDMGVPIVGRVHQSQEGEHSVWMTCDTRPEMTRGSNQQPGLRLALWDKSDMQWKEDLHSNQLVRKQRSLQTQGTLELAQSLLLYDALTMLPKQEFERTTLMEETISPKGLTRGGLSCFKKTGNAKGSNVSGANKESSERVTGKKVKAREEMLKRIEQALTGDE